MLRYIILSTVLLFSTLATIAQPRQLKLTNKSGYYFSGNDSKLKDGVNCFVVNEQKEYEKLFGRKKDIDFEKEWMLVLVMPSTKKDIFLQFNRVSMQAGSFIEVYCDFGKLKGKALTYDTNPLAVCTIPKQEDIRTVRFYEEHKGKLHLVETVQVD